MVECNDVEPKIIIRASEAAVPTPVLNVSKNVTGTRWAFKVKSDGRFKARLVARGWKQRYDYGITVASVCKRVY